MLELQKTIEIAAGAESVFDALTDPAQIPAYFPVKSVALDTRRNGTIEIRGDVNGEAFTDYGIVTEFHRPARFAYRYWSTNHGTERSTANYMTIDYRIEPGDQGHCLVHLHHANLLTSERVQQMDGVWDFLLGTLKKFVES